MSSNVYSVYVAEYSGIEGELLELAKAIHFNNVNMHVYSLRIADAIIKICSEIESIAKDLYRVNVNSDAKSGGVAVRWLEDNWKIGCKKIKINSDYFYFTGVFSNYFAPLGYKVGSKHDYYKVYCALKHDKIKNLNKANLDILIRSCGALFILLCYIMGNRVSSIIFDPLTANTSVGFLMDVGMANNSLMSFLRTSLFIRYYDMSFWSWREGYRDRLKVFLDSVNRPTRDKIIKACLTANDSGDLALYKIILLSGKYKTTGDVFKEWDNYGGNSVLSKIGNNEILNKGYKKVYVPLAEMGKPLNKIKDARYICELNGLL